MNDYNKNPDRLVNWRLLDEAASVLQSTTQTLTEQSAQNAERVRQQVIAEAEEQHNRKKEGYQKEVLEQLRINAEETQITIQQVKQQAQQEAQHHVGTVMDFAEQAHRNTIIAQKEKAEQAEAKLNEQMKAKQTPNHNTTPRNERTTSTPDNSKSQSKNRTFTKEKPC